MPDCPSCSASNAATSKFCAACGAALTTSATNAATATVTPGNHPAAAPTVVNTHHTTVLDDALFTPGSIISQRYRIIARLGKGGMGEVYRADDLSLGQPVALKFLPAAVAANPRWLERFRNEVRVARQVAHPNVCRVHDLGELSDGTSGSEHTHHFLTMEYIDGEDLASLLRRIGRLPRDKAVQVARQLCAGLAAAHASGVLHRDLKPANVMLDGRGNAKITDFGIASLRDRIEGADIRSGTPAYMAPEQLAGREVTVRSDIYSLGLVLYELFTGKPAFDAATVTAAGSSRASTTLSRPSTIIEDMDPSVERVIMRCLDDDPSQRPSGALAVAAALPGGDPLRAALEAGETPSPELVAAAGPDGRVPTHLAIGVLAATLVCISLLFVFGRYTELCSYLPKPRSAAVLTDKARDALKALGYAEEPKDTSGDFFLKPSYLSHIRNTLHTPDRWNALQTGRPSVLRYWYRTSPESLVASNIARVVTTNDPPFDIPGMTMIELDSLGRLHAFRAVPPSRITVQPIAPAQPIPFDWTVALNLAGIEPSSLKSATPLQTPPVASDTRSAWDGPCPETPDIQLHLEAASFAGKPVWFRIYAPWDLESATETPERAARVQGILSVFMQAFLMVGIATSALLARSNYLSRRGDRSGAARLGLGFCVLAVVSWSLSTHFEPNIMSTWMGFQRGLSRALLYAILAWTFYMALEPFVRRRKPELIVSWTRLVAGRWRDTLVGRDCLAGLFIGALVAAASRSTPLLSSLLTGDIAQPQIGDIRSISGVFPSIQLVIDAILSASINSLLLFFLFITLIAFLGRFKIGIFLFSLIACLTMLDGSTPGTHPAIAIGFAIFISFAFTFTLYRFGLLTFTTGVAVLSLLTSVHFTPNAGEWYATGMIAALAATVALATWAFCSATSRWRSPAV